MNNIPEKIYKFLSRTLIFFSGFLFLNCGLESVDVLDSATTVYNQSYSSTSDPLQWYVAFKTSEKNNSNLSSSIFLGTAIYYKIYNNSSVLTTQKSAINAVNTSSNGTAAAEKIITTYKYQTLATSASTVSPLVDNKGSDRDVYIRLKKYAAASASGANTPWYSYYAGIEIDGTMLGAIPYRNGGTKSFDFFNDANISGSTVNVKPVEGDEDYVHSSSATSSDTYYVQLFAIGIAENTDTFVPNYSLVLDLGTIPIKDGE